MMRASHREESNMDLPGSPYLYALAALAMTFAGFSAVAIVLRQTLGRRLSPFHLLVTRLYIESGFWAAAFSMMAPLLALCELPPDLVWRLSSIAIAAILIAYGATYPVRRRRIVPDGLPSRRWIAIGCVSLVVVAALIGNGELDPGMRRHRVRARANKLLGSRRRPGWVIGDGHLTFRRARCARRRA
jgi:hypothetical protein